MKVLIAGESWLVSTQMTAGVDSFTLSSYMEEAEYLRHSLHEGGHDVQHLPSHKVPLEFPNTPDGLSKYNVIILSDVGAHSFLLSSAVLDRSERQPNRLEVLATWVRDGGGLLMIGGYLSFNGFEGKGHFGGTGLEPVLPVRCIPGDDRVECPSGCTPRVHIPEHPAIKGVPTDWPHFLGWNRTILRDDSDLVVGVGSDPLLAVRTVGAGHSAVFTSDCAPHWAPPAFLRWDGYTHLWDSVIRWLAGG